MTKTRLLPKPTTLYNIFGRCGRIKKKRQVGRIVIGRIKIFILAYADDLAMLAKSEKDMKKMLKNLEKYLEGKRLTLNAGKSKILLSAKRKEVKKKNGNGRMKK